METTKKLIPHIPEALMEEIISRLPVKALMRFRSVSRWWNNLISEPRFCTSHLKKSMIHHYHTKIMYLKKCSKILVYCDKNGRPVHGGLKSCFSLLAYCNGLFCINIDKDVFLWNPSTKQSRKISTSRIKLEFPEDDEVSGALVCFGLGHHVASDDYKLVRISSLHRMTDVQIYSRNNGTWRQIQDFPYTSVEVDPGVFVNGCLHWIVRVGSTRKVGVLNLDDESCDSISLPEFGSMNFVLLDLGSLDEKLILFYPFFDDNSFNIWFLKEHGRAESWTRIKMTLDRAKMNAVVVFLQPICLVNRGLNRPGQILIRLDDNELVTLDVEGNRCSDIYSPLVLEDWGIGQIIVKRFVKRRCPEWGMGMVDVEEKGCRGWKRTIEDMIVGFVESLVSPNAPKSIPNNGKKLGKKGCRVEKGRTKGKEADVA